MFQEFIYSEMREHAKSLEVYCALFEITQNRINVEKEFYEAMKIDNKFD